MTLNADDFIRRFLLHTVPDGFHRIRHIGFMANGHRTEKLALCRTLLAAPTPQPAEAESYRDRTQRLTGHALDICPDCGGAMQQRGDLPRCPPARQPFWCDSS
jgi:Putative transposase